MSVRAVGNTRTLVALLAASSLFVAGCGGSASDSTADSATPAAVPAATTPAATQPDTAVSAHTTTVVGLLTIKNSRFFMKPSTTQNGADQVRGHVALGPDGLKKGLNLKITSHTKIKTAKGAPVSLSKFKTRIATGGVMVVKVHWTFKKAPTSPAQLSGKAPDSVELFS